MRLAVSLLVILAGCGVTSPEPFAIETPGCSVVNTVQASGSMSPWNDCRVYWSGSSSEVLTVELTVPGTTGSFAAPDFMWVRASVHAAGGSTTGVHHSATFPSSADLPTAVPDGMVMLQMRIQSCDNVTQSSGGGLDFKVSADVGNASASFSFAFPSTGADCYYSGGSAHVTGGFVISASGAAASNDPAAVEAVPAS